MFILRVFVLVQVILSLTDPGHALERTCEASWYGKGFNEKPMANGQPFNMHDPGLAAHKTLPFGTRLRVTNLVNGKSLVVRVTDRGPHVRGRCVDLSRAGADQLGFRSRGHTPVHIQVIR